MVAFMWSKIMNGPEDLCLFCPGHFEFCPEFEQSKENGEWLGVIENMFRPVQVPNIPRFEKQPTQGEIRDLNPAVLHRTIEKQLSGIKVAIFQIRRCQHLQIGPTSAVHDRILSQVHG